MAPIQNGSPFIDIDVKLQVANCIEDGCQEIHPNIKTFSAEISLVEDQSKIGLVKIHILHKAAMDAIAPRGMKEESEVYDEMHLGQQLAKIEHYLFNEDLNTGKDTLMAAAQMVVFVEEVWLTEKARGNGRSLAAVRESLVLLRVPPQTVVLLQPGSTDVSQFDIFETDEKLNRHWAKLGFEVWSRNDPAWLGLSLEDEVYGLAALRDQVVSPKDGRS